MAIPNITPITKEYKLPSDGTKIKIRPYTVKEEEALSLAAVGDDWKEIYNCVKDTINLCILTPDIDVEKMAMFDLEYLFVQMRALAVGSRVNGYVICKDDNKTQVPYGMNYDELEIEKNPKHKSTIKLSENYVMEMNYPGLETLIDRLPYESNTNKDINKSRDIKKNSYIASYVKRVYKGDTVYDRTTQSDKDYEEFIDSLLPKDLVKIEKFFDTMPRLVHKFKGYKSKY